MDSIREWLNSHKNYTQGMALYECYGDNPALKQMFAQGHSPYRQERLEKVLRDLLKTARPITIPTATKPIIVHIKAPNSPEYRVTERDDPYYKDWLPIFREMNRLRGQLRIIQTNEERGAAAFRILELQKQCMYWWRKRDYYIANGKELQETPETDAPAIVTNPAFITKRMLTVRTYVTRYKAKCKANPTDPNLQQKLEQYTAELHRLERLTQESIT